jgi:voltage-gated potassium channel
MNTTNHPSSEREILNDERRQLLEQLEDRLETPLLVLGFVWLAMFIYESVWGEDLHLSKAEVCLDGALKDDDLCFS